MFEVAGLKNRIAVIGVRSAPYGNVPQTDDYGLAAQVFRNAVAYCGIDKNQMDGLLVCHIPY
jgi:hypothetical protein